MHERKKESTSNAGTQCAPFEDKNEMRNGKGGRTGRLVLNRKPTRHGNLASAGGGASRKKT
jgi:hypothetical protein